VATTPGSVPRVRAKENFRIPDLAVACTRYETEEYDVSNPVPIVEILSPSNRAKIWQNVWAFTTVEVAGWRAPRPSLALVSEELSTSSRFDFACTLRLVPTWRGSRS
jgi:hypothetical protein